MAMPNNTPYYAAGPRSSGARADGNGGLLPKGWYINRDGGRFGPYTTAKQAEKATAPSPNHGLNFLAAIGRGQMPNRRI